MKASPTIRRLETIAHGLLSLKEEVVFVGGATVGLYLQNPASPDIRPTDDVDCIIELAGYSNYAGLEGRLRCLGFDNDTSPSAPVCRWLYEGIKVDVMPTEGTILGFTNRWYKPGMAHRVPHTLPDGQVIGILASPFFIATKLEAFANRGAGDFRFSADMEDVIAILDGRDSLRVELAAAPTDVRSYLAERFGNFLRQRAFLESLEGYLPAAQEGKGRQERVLSILRGLVLGQSSK